MSPLKTTVRSIIAMLPPCVLNVMMATTSVMDFALWLHRFLVALQVLMVQLLLPLLAPPVLLAILPQHLAQQPLAILVLIVPIVKLAQLLAPVLLARVVISLQEPPALKRSQDVPFKLLQEHAQLAALVSLALIRPPVLLVKVLAQLALMQLPLVVYLALVPRSTAALLRLAQFLPIVPLLTMTLVSFAILDISSILLIKPVPHALVTPVQPLAPPLIPDIWHLLTQAVETIIPMEVMVPLDL